MHAVAELVSVVGVLERPLLGLLDGSLLVRLPGISDLLIQWVIQVGQGHQSLNGEQDRSDLKGWRPLVLQDVEADSPELVNVGVVDLRSEKHLWWNHGVLIWQKELAVEDAALVWSLTWTSNLDEEVSGVVLVWLSVDANDWVLCKSLRLLQTQKAMLRSS